MFPLAVICPFSITTCEPTSPPYIVPLALILPFTPNFSPGVFVWIERLASIALVPIPTLPADVIRSLSDPDVCAVMVSFAGKEIKVFSSPKCFKESPNKIFVLEKGQIVESGNHEELSQLENGTYKKLSSLQFQA